MKTNQPNFEKLKTIFYQAFYKSDIAALSLAFQPIRGDFRPFHVKKEEFLKEFNTWLDRLDIRQAGTIIDILNEQKKTVPGWMAKKRYILDYNSNGALDLLRI